MGIFDKDNVPLEGEALQEHIEEALAVQPPSGPLAELTYQIIKRVYSPTVVGADNIPDRPCLFIGNHSLFALDGMLLAPLMLEEYGRFLRGLGDKFLFTVPAVRDRIVQQGAVVGHPEVCSAMMEAGQDLMVFPGGAHEAVKPSAEKYTLQWRERYGFVRLAAKHGYTIMPLAMVGPDEFFGHLMEGQDLPESALGKLLKRMGVLTDDTRTDLLPPIPVGALGTLIPKPQRCYIQFGEPVDLASYAGKRLTKKQQQSIRDAVAAQIEAMLRDLLLLRAQQKGENGFLRRLLTL
jgi:1-acyl-sn-glycerol-3-phosphate acyltransferase